MIDILKLDIGKARFGNVGAANFEVVGKKFITRIAAEIKNPGTSAIETNTDKLIKQLSREKNWAEAEKKIINAYNNGENSMLDNYIVIERQKTNNSKNSFWYLNNKVLTDSKEDCKKFELIFKLLEKLKTKNPQKNIEPKDVDKFIKALTPNGIKTPEKEKGNRIQAATNKQSFQNTLESLQYRIIVGMHKLFNVPLETIK